MKSMKNKKIVKKAIGAILAVWMLAGLFSFTASAQNVVNTVHSCEQITSEPTVYLGEIVLDGETVLTYIYSDFAWYLYQMRPDYETGEYYREDIALATVIESMDRTAFADLMTAFLDELVAQNGHHAGNFDGIRLCSDAAYTDCMDDTWAAAETVAALVCPGMTVVSESSDNAYDIDEGFRTAFDLKEQERTAVVDDPVDSEKRVIVYTDVNTNSNVYYTVEDGEIVKHVDTFVTFSCAAITVLYTKVELSSGAVAVGDINGDGSVDTTDVTALLNVLAGVFAKNAACDVDGSGNVNIDDVTVLLNILAA